MVSVLARAGFAVPTGESARLGGGASPPPLLSEVRELLNAVDYSLPFPKAADLTPHALLRTATNQGHIDQAAEEMERFVRTLGSAGSDGDLEASLLAALLEQIDAHADTQAALLEAEETAANGVQLPQSSMMARLVGVSNRLFSGGNSSASVGGRVRSSSASALDFIKTAASTPGSLFDEVQHPLAWVRHLEQRGATATGTGRLERLLSSTAEATILALQNEQISRSNAAHARAAERAATAARHAAEQAARRQREERERAEQRAQEAAEQARERAALAERTEQERLRKLEEEQERRQRAEQAYQDRLELEKAQAEEATAAEPAEAGPEASATAGAPNTTPDVDMAEDVSAVVPESHPVTVSETAEPSESEAVPAAARPERRSTRKRRRAAAAEQQGESESEDAEAPAAAAAAKEPDAPDADATDDDDDALPLSALLEADDDARPLSALLAAAPDEQAARPTSGTASTPLAHGRSLRSKKQKRYR